MKKFLASTAFIALFATYALYLHSSATVIADTQTPTDTQTIATADTASPAQTQVATTQNTQPATAATNSNTASTVSTNTNTNTTPTPKPTQTVAVASTPVDVPKGQYKDGTYTGSSADAFYGYVQVQVTVAGGKVADVAFLSYPGDRRQSEEINSRAMPILKREAITAQSAQVDGVSGATDTSDAFVQSLASALAEAKA